MHKPLLVVTLIGTALLGGCGITAEQRSEMAKSDSILGPLIKQPTPRDAATWASDPYNDDKRARGTVLLANAPFGGADAYLAMYRDYVKDTAAPVRAAAARGLGMHGKPEDVPLVTPLLKDDDKLVRLDAVKALQRLHNPAAIDPLIERTQVEKEADGDVRAAAASALGQYAQPKVLTALIATLADDQYLVTRNAYESLKTLTGNDDLPDDRKSWVRWEDSTDKPFANQRPYYYPVFERESTWTDYLPIVGGPVPNEKPAQPAGAPSLANAGSVPASASGNP